MQFVAGKRLEITGCVRSPRPVGFQESPVPEPIRGKIRHRPIPEGLINQYEAVS